MAAILSHDLNEEMIAKLGGEFAAKTAVVDFAAQLGGKRDNASVEAAGEAVFGSYGARLMRRTLELGEQFPDQTYEVLKAAAKKTGRLFFPHVAQRFLEIVYLSTQPIATVDIMENNHYRLINRMGSYCVFYTGIKEACGESVSGQMPCRHACLRALQELYEGLRLDVTVTQEATVAKDGQCRFAAVNNRPLEPTPWKR